MEVPLRPCNDCRNTPQKGLLPEVRVFSYNRRPWWNWIFIAAV